MGVFKRYKDAQAAQQEAANAVPGAYQSNYTDRIRQTLDALGAGADEAADVGTDSQLYRQYRGNATQNARAAAENAAAGAAALSGGYGSSYANSVAQQGYQQEMANVDNGLAGLREKALNEYQLKKSGLAQLFSGLVNQDSLEAAEHQTAVSHAQDWRDYKLNRASQAASEKESFLNRSVQNVSNVVGAIQKAYDLYKGYDFQQQQLDRQDRQLAAQEEEAKWNGIEQGWKYKNEYGWNDDTLNQYLSRWDVDSGIYDGWTTGNEDTGLSLSDQINLMVKAASVQDDGHPELAQWMLSSNGIDPSILGNYSAALAKNTGSSGGSSRRSGGSSSGSGNSNTPKETTYTVSQLQSMAKEFRTMKTSDPLYAHYKQVLTENGWIKADNVLETGNTNKSGSGQLLTRNSPQEGMTQKYGTVTNTGWTGIPEKKSSGTTTGTTQSKGVDMAVMLAKNYAKKGYSSWAIINNMSENGYSDDEIARALKEAGVTD